MINPDAHAIGGLADLDYGIAVARRGWLSKADVWNSLSLKEMQKSITRHVEDRRG